MKRILQKLRGTPAAADQGSGRAPSASSVDNVGAGDRERFTPKPDHRSRRTIWRIRAWRAHDLKEKSTLQTTDAPGAYAVRFARADLISAPASRCVTCTSRYVVSFVSFLPAPEKMRLHQILPFARRTSKEEVATRQSHRHQPRSTLHRRPAAPRHQRAAISATATRARGCRSRGSTAY